MKQDNIPASERFEKIKAIDAEFQKEQPDWDLIKSYADELSVDLVNGKLEIPESYASVRSINRPSWVVYGEVEAVRIIRPAQV